jgi:hypothetical protein
VVRRVRGAAWNYRRLQQGAAGAAFVEDADVGVGDAREDDAGDLLSARSRGCQP